MYVTDNVGTHIPVLDLMIRLSSIRHILEFGSGVYSTNKLLEFPNLEMLTSYEDSQPWLDKIAKVKNNKLTLIFEKDLLSIARSINLDEFDLIFIDCCNTPEKRAPIVVEIGRRRPKAIVVIHDVYDDIDRVPGTLNGFDNLAIYAKIGPATGILWNQIAGSAKIRGVHFEGMQGIVDA